MLNVPRKEYFSKLYKLPMAVGILLFNNENKVLLLKPTYRDGWLIPGGMVEDSESPMVALKREIKEELGLDLPVGNLLCIDYKSKTELADFDDASLQVIFDGGVISDGDIKLDLDEHNELGFYSMEEAVAKCTPKLAKRLPFCFKAKKNGQSVYLENGEEIG